MAPCLLIFLTSVPLVQKVAGIVLFSSHFLILTVTRHRQLLSHCCFNYWSSQVHAAHLSAFFLLGSGKIGGDFFFFSFTGTQSRSGCRNKWGGHWIFTQGHTFFLSYIYLPQGERWLCGHSWSIVISFSLTNKRQSILILRSPKATMGKKLMGGKKKGHVVLGDLAKIFPRSRNYFLFLKKAGEKTSADFIELYFHIGLTY